MTGMWLIAAFAAGATMASMICMLYCRRRGKRLLAHLQKMLVDAQNGDYEISDISEAKLSGKLCLRNIGDLIIPVLCIDQHLLQMRQQPFSPAPAVKHTYHAGHCRTCCKGCNKPHTRHDPSSQLYPMPYTVLMHSGCLGSSSSLSRRRFTATVSACSSTNSVSPCHT